MYNQPEDSHTNGYRLPVNKRRIEVNEKMCITGFNDSNSKRKNNKSESSNKSKGTSCRTLYKLIKHLL